MSPVPRNFKQVVADWFSKVLGKDTKTIIEIKPVGPLDNAEAPVQWMTCSGRYCLADRLAGRSEDGIAHLVNDILRVLEVKLARRGRRQITAFK